MALLMISNGVFNLFTFCFLAFSGMFCEEKTWKNVMFNIS